MNQMTSSLADDLIVARINSNCMVVAIGGAADLGKSYLADQLVVTLQTKGHRAAALSLDAFLMDRQERQQKGWSGYNIEAYELQKALADLNQIKQGKPIEFYSYNHQLGLKSSLAEKIDSPDILIFEGLFTLHPFFFSLLDFSLFIYTTDVLLKQIRSEADLAKRNYTPEYSKEISELEFQRYKKYVEPLGERADCRLLLKHRWEYKIQS